MLGMFGRRNGDLVPAGGVVGVQVGRGSSRPQALSTPGLQGPEDWDRRLSHVWTSSKDISLCSEPLCQSWPPSGTPPGCGGPA